MVHLLRILPLFTAGLFAFNTASADEDTHAILNQIGRGPDIQIKDPWVRAAAPTVKVLAGYLTIHNIGMDKQRITAVTSPTFNKVEIHKSVTHEGMAQMKHQKELAIPAHGSVELKPGWLHLMLMGKKGSLRAGDQVPITLELGDGKSISFTAEVRSGQVKGMEHSKH